MRTASLHCIALLGLCAATLLGGCSQDKHSFLSTVDLPTTISLIDPYSHKVVWTKDIPVGHKMVIDLDREGEMELMSTEPRLAATKLTWTLFDAMKDEQVDEQELALPGTPVLMRVTYRKAPEYPPPAVPPPGAGSKADATTGAAVVVARPIEKRESVQLLQGP